MYIKLEKPCYKPLTLSLLLLPNQKTNPLKFQDLRNSSYCFTNQKGLVQSPPLLHSVPGKGPFGKTTITTCSQYRLYHFPPHHQLMSQEHFQLLPLSLGDPEQLQAQGLRNHPCQLFLNPGVFKDLRGPSAWRPQSTRPPQPQSQSSAPWRPVQTWSTQGSWNGPTFIPQMLRLCPFSSPGSKWFPHPLSPASTLTFRAQRMEMASTPQRSAEESPQSLLQFDYRRKRLELYKERKPGSPTDADQARVKSAAFSSDPATLLCL